ncbi:alpha/beta hydrolase fold domain-containing protein, partial [Escherichia coli]|nr:alpha/beta hydrolase fold domain-containing protein [Escherichia coli]
NPLSASMEGLPSTLILTGTDDILNADAHRLMASARAAGTDFTLSEYPGM